LSPVNHKHKEGTLYYSEYHPDINISVDYVQLTNNTVNVSVHLIPQHEEIETLTILVFSMNGQKVGEKHVNVTEVIKTSNLKTCCNE